MGKAVLSREEKELLLQELRAGFERVGFLFGEDDYITIEDMFGDLVIHHRDYSGDIVTNPNLVKTILASLPDSAGEKEFWKKFNSR